MIPEPKEIVLKKYKASRKTLASNLSGKKFHQKFSCGSRVTKTEVKKEVIHYVSIIETLRLIMSSPEARKMIDEETASPDGILQTYRDGRQFSNHPFLKKFPSAIRLSIHIDDGEYCNPLGSRKGINKLTNLHFKIQNFDSRINSALNRMYLVMMIKASLIKKFGYAKTLQPLLDDLKQLESTEGVSLKIDSEIITIRAVLVNVLGDTLAIHDLFGLLGPSANKFCRMCEITREDIHNGMIGDHFQYRTKEGVETSLSAIQKKEQTSKSCGIKKLRFTRSRAF